MSSKISRPAERDFAELDQTNYICEASWNRNNVSRADSANEKQQNGHIQISINRWHKKHDKKNVKITYRFTSSRDSYKNPKISKQHFNHKIPVILSVSASLLHLHVNPRPGESSLENLNYLGLNLKHCHLHQLNKRRDVRFSLHHHST